MTQFALRDDTICRGESLCAVCWSWPAACANMHRLCHFLLLPPHPQSRAGMLLAGHATLNIKDVLPDSHFLNTLLTCSARFLLRSTKKKASRTVAACTL